MSESEAEIPQEESSNLQSTLEKLRRTISKDNAVRKHLGTKAEGIDRIESYLGVKFEPGHDRGAVEGIYNKPTKIAMSERTAPETKIREIKDKAEQIRNWILDHGRDLTPEEIEDRQRIGKGNGRIYEPGRPGGKNSNEDKYYGSADYKPEIHGANLAGDFLFFEESSRRFGADMMVKLEFDDTYRLEIDFTTKRNRETPDQTTLGRFSGDAELVWRTSERYNSGTRSYDTMADTDATIISTIFDKFISSQNISSQ